MNLWILTEERPKKNVLKLILEYYAKDHGYYGFVYTSLIIIPILNQDNLFSFTYEVIGFQCDKIDRIYIKTVSGSSSFVDFLIFETFTQPKLSDIPIYAIEETKTDDSESRNTGVYQRCSKFVYIHYFYPRTKLIMLYALQVEQKDIPTETNIFGTRMLRTIGVEILGKKMNDQIVQPFTTLDEFISAKANMKKPPKGNTPILITKISDNLIQISGRLYKNNGLSHDPNIGALSIISTVLRKLDWNGKIEITQHGLQQQHITKNNKFVRIANILNINLEGLNIPQSSLSDNYWHYEINGEKLATIFLHIIVENFTKHYSIFENHAGCEKGYFITKDYQHLPLEKYADKNKYKAGDKNQIIFIPDLVLLDTDACEAITIEGKKYENKDKGIEELNNYDSFDKRYLKYYYPEYKIVRTVVLYGSEKEYISDHEVGFLLNSNGKIVLSLDSPHLFHQARVTLLRYWKIRRCIGETDAINYLQLSNIIHPQATNTVEQQVVTDLSSLQRTLATLQTADKLALYAHVDINYNSDLVGIGLASPTLSVYVPIAHNVVDNNGSLFLMPEVQVGNAGLQAIGKWLQSLTKPVICFDAKSVHQIFAQHHTSFCTQVEDVLLEANMLNASQKHTLESLISEYSAQDITLRVGNNTPNKIAYSSLSIANTSPYVQAITSFLLTVHTELHKHLVQKTITGNSNDHKEWGKQVAEQTSPPQTVDNNTNKIKSASQNESKKTDVPVQENSQEQEQFKITVAPGFNFNKELLSTPANNEHPFLKSHQLSGIKDARGSNQCIGTYQVGGQYQGKNVELFTIPYYNINGQLQTCQAVLEDTRFDGLLSEHLDLWAKGGNCDEAFHVIGSYGIEKLQRFNDPKAPKPKGVLITTDYEVASILNEATKSDYAVVVAGKADNIKSVEKVIHLKYPQVKVRCVKPKFWQDFADYRKIPLQNCQTLGEWIAQWNKLHRVNLSLNDIRKLDDSNTKKLLLEQALKPIELTVSTLFARTGKELSTIHNEYKTLGLNCPQSPGEYHHQVPKNNLYLQNKQIEQTFGIQNSSNGGIEIPFYNKVGMLGFKTLAFNDSPSYQHYVNAPVSNYQQLKGSMHVIDSIALEKLELLKDTDNSLLGIIITEDYASANMFHKATKDRYIVVVASSSDDLANIAKTLHDDYPEASITVAANRDNVVQAQEATKLVDGIVIIPPCKGNTFNDWVKEWCSDHNLPLTNIRNLDDGKNKQELLKLVLEPLVLTMMENYYLHPCNAKHLGKDEILSQLERIHTEMKNVGIPSQLLAERKVCRGYHR